MTRPVAALLVSCGLSLALALGTSVAIPAAFAGSPCLTQKLARGLTAARIEEDSSKLQAEFTKLGARGDLGPAIDEFIAHIPEREVKPGEELPDAIQAYLDENFPTKAHRALVLPRTMGYSGAPVWVIQVDGKPAAAAKAYPDDPRSMAMELVGLKTMRAAGISGWNTIAPNGYFKLRDGGRVTPVLLLDFAPGEDLASLIRDAAASPAKRETLDRAAEATGRALAGFHRRFRWKPTGQEEPIRSYMDFELSRLSTMLGAKGPIPWESMVHDGWLSPEEKSGLMAAAARVRSAYESAGMKWATYAHADLHPGNLFFEAATGKLTVIDAQDSVLAFTFPGQGALRGNVDPLNDVGRFDESLALQGRRYGLSQDAIARAQGRFLASYLQATGMRPEEIEKGLDFYRMRVDLRDLSPSPRTSSNEICQTLDGILRRLGIRAAGAPPRCG